MDYQDKLRLAKEALDSGFYDKETIEYIFPELKESEDEKIRKEIIVYLESVYLHKEYRDKTIEGWIDWLKKQNEQKTVSKTDPIVEGLTTEFQKQVSHLIASAMDKEHEYTKGYVEWVAQSLLGYAKNELTSTDEIKPRFKVGDWVRAISSGNIFKILSVNDGLYRVLCYDGVEANYPIIDVEKDLAYWSIQDAKDGDVLVDSLPFIFKKIDANKYSYAYCGISVDYSFQVESEGEFGEWTQSQGIKPATKKQRDFLFQKMKEAGYEWDVEKKELKKIEL